MDNNIYEITKLMEDKNIIKEDLNIAIASVKDTLYEKYLAKFQTVIDEQKKIVEENSNKEIQLIKALKPFLPTNSQQNIDTMIEFIYKFSTAKNIQKELQQIPSPTSENIQTVSSATVHSDGIYEIDKSCTIKNSVPANSNTVTELIFLLMLGGVI